MITQLLSGVFLFKTFRSIVWELLSDCFSELQTRKILQFGCELKEIFEKEDENLEITFGAIDCILRFKRENPKEFAKLLELLEKASAIYEENPQEIQQKLREILN